MLRQLPLWIVASLLTACGSAGVRPDEMSAQAHRQEAAYERHTAAARERRAAEQPQGSTPPFDPYSPSQMGLDPAEKLRWEAESRRAHALQHEAAARELERFEAEECKGIEPRARGACPVLGPVISLRDIPAGVRIELASSGDISGVVALMRCHLAYAESRGFEEVAAACPLYIRGIQIRASADGMALEIIGGTERLVKEIRRLSRETVRRAPQAKPARSLPREVWPACCVSNRHGGNSMENMDQIFSSATAEIERILNSKTVVGEPIKINGTTLIPLLSIGFGFGLGTGTGTDPKRGQGVGGGVGGGGGIKPVAVLVVDASGVRLETIKGGAASALEKVAEGIGRVVSRRAEEKAPG
jgi:uncharacterized spore protein YtfJ